MSEPTRVDGVLLDAADAAYLVEAIDVFGSLAAGRGSTLTPRIARLRATLAAATGASTDVDARTSDSNTLWQALSHHDLLTSAEAARLLGITPGGVRDLARRGAIDAHRSGRQWIYSKESIELRAQRRTA